ncbi:hypothetical protein L1987_06391 [Smallanthus sonchifolius]|uniref:Uncharacterized protein n=1 Tax=Smallanthus sonchifolius TaxID=185202 RepID=A0ACB9JY70_9ASTR|nr:hypothetical protein L1987_06391 [Smallanthus sonchifolius]
MGLQVGFKIMTTMLVTKRSKNYLESSFSDNTVEDSGQDGLDVEEKSGCDEEKVKPDEPEINDMVGAWGFCFGEEG